MPPVDDAGLFRALVDLGGRLTAAHLLESAPQGEPAASFPVTGDNVVEKGHPKYCAPGEIPQGESVPAERGRVYISASAKVGNTRGQYFDGIAPEVWEFRVGGYQPMDKWLKDRRGRELSFGDIAHYRRIAHALQETIALMAEVDAAIANSGTPWQWGAPGVAD